MYQTDTLGRMIVSPHALARAAALGLMLGACAAKQSSGAPPAAVPETVVVPAAPETAEEPVTEPLAVAEPEPERKAGNCCAGKNDCKGKGGCRVAGSHACAGHNDCKGRGGCKTGACPEAAEGKSCCKGLNECKGKGSCKSDAHDCAGKNECKGQGGCAMHCPR